MPHMSASFRVRHADWHQDQPALRRIREAVFVHEQRVPLELEWDGIDEQCAHAIAEDAYGAAIGTGRLLPDGHIGRMAVLQPWRGKGVGSALLGCLIELARQRGLREIVLNAQTQAVPFYAQHGFAIEGGEFFDAGIAHLCMRKSLVIESHEAGNVDGAGSSKVRSGDSESSSES